MKDDNSKAKALATAMTSIEKQFGKGSIMTLAGGERPRIPVIPTGSIGLDKALGVGGWPRSRICEIYGNESAGKSTMTLHAVAEAQKAGGVAAIIDAEHAFDPAYAENLGVNLDDLIFSQPDTGEEALEIAEMLVRSEAVDLIVIDSVAALVPKAEIEGAMGDSHVGLQARMMSQALRKLTGVVSKSRATVIFVNQIRLKIGVMFGNPETTSGGNALKFYASVRLDIRRIGAVKEGDEITGNETRVKVVKNKVAPPFKKAEFQILYGSGINRVGELISAGVEAGLIEKSGAWYAIDGEKIGQGMKNACEHLRQNPAVMQGLESALTEYLFPPRADATEADQDEASLDEDDDEMAEQQFGIPGLVD